MAEGEDPRIVAEFSDYNELITRCAFARPSLIFQVNSAIFYPASRPVIAKSFLARTRSDDWAQFRLDRS